MIPIPILRIVRGRQSKSGIVKTHPRPAVLHVIFKSLALGRRVRPSIEEKHHLILRKKGRVQLIPVRRRVIGEIIFGRHLRKPAVGFVDKTDMGQIVFARVESDHLELGRWTLRVEIGGTQNDRSEFDAAPEDGWEGVHNYFVTLLVILAPLWLPIL